jgi:FkbM family methyltransferase
MNNISKLRENLCKEPKIREDFIKSLVNFEIDNGFPNTDIREKITSLLSDELFMGESFIKELSNGLKIKFTYNSKIAREFLLSTPSIPNHVWEPQTTKLLLHFSKGVKSVIIAGAYFGDQAILVANNIKEVGNCFTFEPNANNSNLIKENATLNNLENVIVNNLALWNKSNVFLEFEGDDALASTVEKLDGSNGGLHTITIDDYVNDNNIDSIGLLMIDVEGSETKVLEGAIEMINKNKPVIVFETHSLYDDWSNGLENSPSVNILSKIGYSVFAIREYHQNIDTGDMPIELLPLDKTYCEIPPHHGFNLLAVPNDTFINNNLFRIVNNLSPKLISHKIDALFQPSKF